MHFNTDRTYLGLMNDIHAVAKYATAATDDCQKRNDDAGNGAAGDGGHGQYFTLLENRALHKLAAHITRHIRNVHLRERDCEIKSGKGTRKR